MFRVNGAAMFMRGASMIPMEELEGWMDAAAHFEAVVSAAEGRFNMLRAWGGGIWYPQVWYDTCDALGIMVRAALRSNSSRCKLVSRTQTSLV